MQILLTVFAHPAVQTAAVSLNEDTIANLGISDYRDAKPNDYVFTRLEIETYRKEYAYGYVAPSPLPSRSHLPQSPSYSHLHQRLSHI